MSAEIKKYDSHVKPILFRFIEQIDGNGKSVWKIQRKLFWFWWKYIGSNNSYSDIFLIQEFSSFEDAVHHVRELVINLRSKQRKTICQEVESF